MIQPLPHIPPFKPLYRLNSFGSLTDLYPYAPYIMIPFYVRPRSVTLHCLYLVRILEFLECPPPSTLIVFPRNKWTVFRLVMFTILFLCFMFPFLSTSFVVHWKLPILLKTSLSVFPHTQTHKHNTPLLC